MSEKSVFVLDDRPATNIPLLPELESRKISYTVIGNVFQAIRRIPDINDDGIIIKGFLDWELHDEKQLWDALSEIFPEEGGNWANMLSKKVWQDNFKYQWAIFYRAFLGWKMQNGGLKAPLSVMFNSGWTPANQTMEASTPITSPKISTFRVPDFYDDPRNVDCAKKDDPETLKAFLDSLRA
jgi:hypothetical protein